MNDVLACVASVGIFFGAIALRGIFGYLKNKQISVEDIKFDWKKFLSGSVRPILITLAVGALAGLIIGFFTLVDKTGVQIEGLEQISVHTLLIGLMIADVGAIGYAISEGLGLFGLNEADIKKIRESAQDGEVGLSIGLDENGNVIASAETITDKSDKGQLEEDGVEVEHGEELQIEEVGKGAVWVNTYPEPYRSSGKDTRIDPSTCYNRECVSYCAWKIREATGSWPKRTGDMNAKNWIYRLPSWGYRNVSAPQSGGLYVGVLISGTYGHVVWYEYGNTVSEYNYASQGNYGVRNINLGQYQWFEIRAPKSPVPVSNVPKIGDRVKTSATKDRSGVRLNLKVINDGQSVWDSTSGNYAILTKGKVIRCAVPVSSLTKC